MEKAQAQALLKSTLAEIRLSNGQAALNNFHSLRDVDAKIRDVRMILEGVEGLPQSLLPSMNSDLDFQVNSRRVRLEALGKYVTSAIRFLDTGAFERPKKVIHPPPDLTRLTTFVPGLKEELDKRWRECQRCVHALAFTSAVIMMGSVLEGLLLGRATLDLATAYRSSRVPQDRKTGRPISVNDWTLSTLIDVATDVGWLKVDRGKFSHALRESRNVVHPWQAVTSGANFDEDTCKTTWQVLDASVSDLLRSVP